MYFGKFLKCFGKTAKFEFFAKQIIYLESPDHPLQNDMIYLCSKSLKFFRTSNNGLKSDYFTKIANKIAKSKYFSDNIKSTIRGTFLVGEVLSSITLSLFEILQPNLVNLYYLRHFLKLYLKK